MEDIASVVPEVRITFTQGILALEDINIYLWRFSFSTGGIPLGK
jgi:hypothetical protein